MTLTVCPQKIDEHVRSLCSGIVAGQIPILVSVIPEADCVSLECFSNVKNVVEKKGGEFVLGWQIWTWPRVFIEAEHHYVWRQADGQLVDVTPKIDGEGQILFLHDETAFYDFSNHRRRDNIRKPLTRNAKLIEFLELNAEKHALIENCTVGDQVILQPEDQANLRSVESRKFILYNDLILKYVHRNDVCPCGSGKKYKRCHYKRRILPQEFQQGQDGRL